jgi:hypothetical protein
MPRNAQPVTAGPAPRGPRILWGLKAIADHLDRPTSATRHLIDDAGLPVFRVGGRLCARPEAIEKWLAELERAALDGDGP